jgi:sterol desaturase/sphingolipid hydroxylase (fatty acid hydroxylase superfamily)
VTSDVLARIGKIGSAVFFDLNSTFSLASLVSALMLAAGAIVVARLRRRGRIGFALLAKALAPRPVGASGHVDLCYFFFNNFIAGLLIGGALLSQSQVAAWTHQALTAVVGPSGSHVRGVWPATLYSASLFIAFDFAYWLDHWLSHRVPALWEIHKVHHTAEALSPLTTFRVHPLESLHFYNLTAVFTGLTAGVLDYALGSSHGRLTLLGADVFLLAGAFTVGHLLHSHVWIAYRGGLARVLMSPAAHQVHHSTDPRHFGRNLGNFLAVWDWLFGTLYAPSRTRERLTFGVDGEGPQAHSVQGALVAPVLSAARALPGAGRVRAVLQSVTALRPSGRHRTAGL